MFDGVDVILNARLPRGGFLTGGTSTGREVFDNCFAAEQPDLTATAFTNPSVAAATLTNNPSGFCRVSPPFLTQLKLQGSYPLAWDFQISAAYSAIVRSLENFPEVATLMIAFRVQAS